MATIRKRFGKWQIQIRRQHYPLITKTFLSKKTAEQWDRKIGNEIDKGILNLCKKESTLRALVDRYISEISSKKRGYFNEKTAFLVKINPRRAHILASEILKIIKARRRRFFL